MFVTLVPAYGRDYKSAKAVKEAWANNQDFQIQCIAHPDNGRYINKSDFEKYGKGEKLTVRYGKLTKVCKL